MDRHVLVNGLSVGSGGGYTVARELTRHLAELRPSQRFTLALIEGHPLHEAMRRETWPGNCEMLWSPRQALNRLWRSRYESGALTEWAEAQRVSVVLQLNGMVIPAMHPPTLSHSQDPWPYRSAAWGGAADRFIAFLKRREQARALRTAACVGFTSGYLRDLVCNWTRVRPQRTEVFYNGLPDSWIERARGELPGLAERAPEIISVSNVAPYKRQSLVIRALPRLIADTGIIKLVYRIVGHVTPTYERRLRQLAAELGVADHVVIEGRVTDERVEQLLAQARCFVLMSVCESFGIPAVEAMSWGTPVVTSDCCAMPEVCGDAAELCPVDDVDALVERLGRVLTDDQHARHLSRCGAQQAQRFVWRDTAAKMADCLQDLQDQVEGR